MKCPFCASSDTQVLESRAVEEGRAVRRRRECEKVKRGILRAVEKRPISLDLVDDVVNQIEREMLKKEKEEVSSKAIGHAVLKRLKKIDKVAWLRFASVYLQFEDLEDFARAIKT